MCGKRMYIVVKWVVYHCSYVPEEELGKTVTRHKGIRLIPKALVVRPPCGRWEWGGV